MNYIEGRRSRPVAVTAADGNRRFSTLLREVRAGKSFVITSHGRPVARIVPVDAEDRVTGAARTALFNRLHRAKIRRARPWRREDLYEDVE